MGGLWMKEKMKNTPFFSRMSDNWCLFISDEGKGLSQMKGKYFGVATIPWVQKRLYFSLYYSDIPVAIPERTGYEKDM